MIIDVHTHYWPSHDVFSSQFLAEASRMRSDPIDLTTRYADYGAKWLRRDYRFWWQGKVGWAMG